MADGETKDAGVKSVHLTIDMLEALSSHEDPVGVSELAQILGTSKGTAFRHLQTLMERGYVSQNSETQRYSLGAQLAVLGKIASERVSIASASQGPLRALRDETAETAVLCLADNQGLVVLTTIIGKSTLEIGVRTGSRLALHCTSQGKIMLAYGPPAHLIQLRRKGLERYTDATPDTMDALEGDLARIRAEGIADAPNQETVGINALAAPIFDGSGKLAATIAIVGSVQNIDRQRYPDQVRAVRQAAEMVSVSLGYRGSFLRA